MRLEVRPVGDRGDRRPTRWKTDRRSRALHHNARNQHITHHQPCRPRNGERCTAGTVVRRPRHSLANRRVGGRGAGDDSITSITRVINNHRWGGFAHVAIRLISREPHRTKSRHAAMRVVHHTVIRRRRGTGKPVSIVIAIRRSRTTIHHETGAVRVLPRARVGAASASSAANAWIRVRPVALRQAGSVR